MPDGFADGVDDIYVAGSCVGCTMVYVGLNDDGEPLEAGDLVAVSGVNDPLAVLPWPNLAVTMTSPGGR